VLQLQSTQRFSVRPQQQIDAVPRQRRAVRASPVNEKRGGVRKERIY